MKKEIELKISQIKGHKINQLTVPELEKELEKRNLPTQSTKLALIARLREAMKSEGYDLEADADSVSEMGAERGKADEKQEACNSALMRMLFTIQKLMEKQSADFNKQSSETNTKLDQQSTKINMKLDQQSTKLKPLDEKLDARMKYFDEQISTVAGKLKSVSDDM